MKKSFKIILSLVILSQFLFIQPVKADETLDMASWITATGRNWTISGLEFSGTKNYNSDAVLNDFNVVGGIYYPPTDHDYLDFSYFERSTSAYTPCGQASFSISLWFYFTDSSFLDYVKSIRWGDNVCSITSKNSDNGRVYATCVVPYNSSNFNDIFVDYIPFTTNAGVSSNLYISRYNQVTCSLDTQSIISNNNVNTDKIISSNEKTQEKIDSTNEKLDNLNSNLNDSDTSEATNSASDFFNGFTTDTFGLTSIITSPLTLIGSITSSTCSPLSLEVPFLTKNNKLNLPCMSSIYEENFGSFLTIYQTITFGIVAYWVCVKIFALVKEFKNPDSDKVEVLDL